MNTRIVLGIIVVVIVAAVAGAYAITGNTFHKDAGQQAQAAVREFSVDAFRFGYNPDTIRISSGETVKITVNNTDTMHGIRIPDLGMSGDNYVEFTANETGNFTWYCNRMCGSGHMSMHGTLEVV
jgi:cytochrome c oxidase subunit 2